MPNEHKRHAGLEPWEGVEADAEADLLDADVERCGAPFAGAGTVAVRGSAGPAIVLSDADLAEAECERDLAHVEAAF
jgi:hypothetical protein